MSESKIVNSEEIKRGNKWFNYGVNKEGTKVYRWDNLKPMKIMLSGRKEYLSFRACHNNKASNVQVHRLVADAWIMNDSPNTKTFVNHKDGNKFNNHITNLEWVTHAQNMQHRSTELSSKGSSLYNATLTDENAHKACKLLQEGLRPIDIAKNIGVTVDCIRQLRSGSTYFHIRSLYDIDTKYQQYFSEETVIWVCMRISEGLSDTKISAMSTNKSLKTIDVKRIRHKIRYKNISDNYF